jgi:hypothetical protein
VGEGCGGARTDEQRGEADEQAEEQRFEGHGPASFAGAPGCVKDVWIWRGWG